MSKLAHKNTAVNPANTSKETKSINQEEECKFIYLRDLCEPISFSVNVELFTNKTTVTYTKEDYLPEVFNDFSSFLKGLSSYYRNMIDSFLDSEDKVTMCNQFMNSIQGYRLQFRGCFKDKGEFDQDIDFHIKQFTYYKERVKEEGRTKISNNKDVKKESLSTKQQVLILDYLGFFQLLASDITEKAKAEIVASIIGKDATNTTRAIRSNIKPVEKGQEYTKTRANLEFVQDFFKRYDLKEIETKVQEDLNKLNKG